MFAYLAGMFLVPKEGSEMELYFGPTYSAFRFPDEQTAQAVLKFLNRDNLEVACISGSNQNLMEQVAEALKEFISSSTLIEADDIVEKIAKKCDENKNFVFEVDVKAVIKAIIDIYGTN